MNTQNKTPLEKALDLMPEQFSSLTFAKTARSLGVSDYFTATGGCAYFLKKYCTQLTPKRWIKGSVRNPNKENEVLFTPELIGVPKEQNHLKYYINISHSNRTYSFYFCAAISKSLKTKRINIGKLDNKLFFHFTNEGTHELKDFNGQYLGIYSADICKIIAPTLQQQSSMAIELTKLTDNLYFAL